MKKSRASKFGEGNTIHRMETGQKNVKMRKGKKGGVGSSKLTAGGEMGSSEEK